MAEQRSKFDNSNNGGDSGRTTIVGMPIIEIPMAHTQNPLFEQDNPHDNSKLAAVLDYVSLLPEGREMLKMLNDKNIPIVLTDQLQGGVRGLFDPYIHTVPVVFLNSTESVETLVTIAMHEMRHGMQYYALGGKLPNCPNSSSPENGLVMNHFIEADSAVTEFMSALKLKQMGHPQFLSNMLMENLPPEQQPPVLKAVGRYIAGNPPESFSDPADFAKGLFMTLQMNNYFQWYENNYAGSLATFLQNNPNAAQMAAQTAAVTQTPVTIDNFINTPIMQMYGNDTGTLKAAIVDNLNPNDKLLIQAAAKLAFSADALPDASFQAILSDVAQATTNRINSGFIGAEPAEALQKFMRANPFNENIAAQQFQLLEADKTLPKTVKFGEAEIPMIDALRDPQKFAWISSQVDQIHANGEMDMSASKVTLGKFQELERHRSYQAGAPAASGPPVSLQRTQKQAMS